MRENRVDQEQTAASEAASYASLVEITLSAFTSKLYSTERPLRMPKAHEYVCSNETQPPPRTIVRLIIHTHKCTLFALKEVADIATEGQLKHAVGAS